MTAREKVKKIADFYGLNAQMYQLIEEMAELTQAINKYNRWHGVGQLVKQPHLTIINNVCEEIADVEIMLEEIKYLMGISENNLNLIKDAKLQRTIDRMENE